MTVQKDLPSSWVRVMVGEVVRSMQPGFPSGAHNQNSIGLPHLRPMNIDRQGNIDLSIVKYVERADAPLLRCGDVLFNNTNSPELVGKTAFVSRVNKFTYSNHMTCIRAFDGLDGAFLAIQLHYLWMIGVFRALCTNHVNQASVPVDKLARQVEISLPPLPEQHRIVSEIEKQFSLLDAGITNLRSVKINLKRYRASVLQAACEGRLVPTEAELARAEGRSYEPASELLERILVERRERWEAEELARMRTQSKEPTDDKWKARYMEPESPLSEGLPSLPAGWCWASAAQLCRFITKGTTPSADKMTRDSGEIPYIKVYNLTHNGSLDFSINPTFVSRLTHTDELARSRTLPNDLLMNIVGPPLGKVSIVPNDYPEWNVNQAVAIFRPTEFKTLRWIKTCLLCEAILRRITQFAKATAGQYNLTLEQCRNLPIPLPPLSEQTRIADEVDRCLTTSTQAALAANTSVLRASRLRQSILRDAFSGKLVPQDPSDEPASALLERIHTERLAADSARKVNRNGRRKVNDAAGAAVPSGDVRRLARTEEGGIQPDLFSANGR